MKPELTFYGRLLGVMILQSTTGEQFFYRGAINEDELESFITISGRCEKDDISMMHRIKDANPISIISYEVLNQCYWISQEIHNELQSQLMGKGSSPSIKAINFRLEDLTSWRDNRKGEHFDNWSLNALIDLMSHITNSSPKEWSMISKSDVNGLIGKIENWNKNRKQKRLKTKSLSQAVRILKHYEKYFI